MLFLWRVEQPITVHITNNNINLLCQFKKWDGETLELVKFVYSLSL